MLAVAAPALSTAMTSTSFCLCFCLSTLTAEDEDGSTWALLVAAAAAGDLGLDPGLWVLAAVLDRLLELRKELAADPEREPFDSAAAAAETEEGGCFCEALSSLVLASAGLVVAAAKMDEVSAMSSFVT